jgi:hypothetical protein
MAAVYWLYLQLWQFTLRHTDRALFYLLLAIAVYLQAPQMLLNKEQFAPVNTAVEALFVFCNPGFP